MPAPNDASSYERTLQTPMPFESESITASVRYRESLSPGSLHWDDPSPEQADVGAAPAGVRARIKSYQGVLGVAVVICAAFVGFSSHRSAERAADNPLAPSAIDSSASPRAESGLPTLAKDNARQGEMAEAAAREASSPSAALPARKGMAASTPVLPGGPRETCIANKEANVEACVKRVCRTEARFKQ